MKIGIPHLLAALLGCMMIPARAADPAVASAPVSWFPTAGETVYHLKAARTAADVPRSIVAATYSGKVLCFDFAGQKLWEQVAVAATDILSGERLDLRGNALSVRVPMGILRVIDIEHR